MSLKTIIIDDESFVRSDLSHLLGARENIEVASEAGSLAEAKKQLTSQSFDLIFLDVCMPGGNGFDLLPFIRSSSKVVFVTGHDDYAVQAFEINALDYLLKPVSRERLSKTIDRVTSEQAPVDTRVADNKIRVKTDLGYHYILPDNIVSIFSIGGNYIQVTLADQEPLLCRKTLKQWERSLPGKDFLRIHRSTIINTRFIQRVTKRADGGFKVILFQGECFSVSRRMACCLRQWLGRKGGYEKKEI